MFRRSSALRQLRVSWAPSRVRRLVRHRGVASLVVVVAIAVTATAVQQRVADLEQQRASWGATTTAFVITRDVPAGEPLDGRVSIRKLPEALVPTTALRADTAALSDRAQARVDLVAGEIVVASRVTGMNSGRLPDDTVAVTVPIQGAASMVSSGDTVDLWSVDSSTFASARVAGPVRVMQRDGADLTVAVPAADIGAIAAAALRPLVVVLLS